MANEQYPSIDKFYEIAKEEYNYQRNTLQHVEGRTKFIITVLLPAFTFELSKARDVLDFSDGLNNILEIIFSMSICYMLIAIIILVRVYFRSITATTVDVVDFYNKGLYALEPDVFVPFYTAKYLKCVYKNNKRTKRLFILTLLAVLLSIFSGILFGITYWF